MQENGPIFDFIRRKNMLTKKVHDSEKSEKILSMEIESFRMKQGITVKEFCALCHISQAQYSEYVTGKNRYLSITDALKLLAAFPGKMTVNKLLGMSGERRLKLSREFPKILFSEQTHTDNSETEFVFMKFITKTAFYLFAPADAISIVSSFLQPCSDDKIFLPMEDNMNCLMSKLRKIRKIKYSDFKSARRTVISHFQRDKLPVRFSDVCGYERIFRSGGIYLLSEIMYLNEKKKIGIKLYQNDNM